MKGGGQQAHHTAGVELRDHLKKERVFENLMFSLILERFSTVSSTLARSTVPNRSAIRVFLVRNQAVRCTRPCTAFRHELCVEPYEAVPCFAADIETPT